MHDYGFVVVSLGSIKLCRCTKELVNSSSCNTTDSTLAKDPYQLSKETIKPNLTTYMESCIVRPL